ncbi:Protein CMSS1 [Hondaea fermentalgiana]|uniref:Protein CMSS1 n=1 Tax=Hondaea fermentalgiana TaxID=2315210 RepID=A0A2R5G7J3_9STRA|nr:Protein CMSS1 [Hondaea fermentalgiana]|eukprot:GBG26299.1 Protein CMSS1 [Hondaea fermentalgiana]
MVLLDARTGGGSQGQSQAKSSSSKKRRRNEDGLAAASDGGQHAAGSSNTPKKRRGDDADKDGAKKQKQKQTRDKKSEGKDDDVQKGQAGEPNKNKKTKQKKQQVSSKKRAKVRQDVSLAEAGGELHLWFKHRYETEGSKLSKIELYPGLEPFSAADFWPVKTGKKTLDSLKEHLDTKRKSTVLLVTRSAVRACDLLKTLSVLQRPVGKLFAKHMKLDEQVKYLQGPGSALDVAIGTPNRLLKLAEASSLSNFLSNPDAVIVFDLDRDVKNYHVLSMPAVGSDAFFFLRKFWLPQKAGSRAKIVIFSDEKL